MACHLDGPVEPVAFQVVTRIVSAIGQETHCATVLPAALSSAIRRSSFALVRHRSAVARTGRNLPWHCWREYPPRHDHTTPISGRTANDTGQHAGNGVGSLAVSCHL